MARQELNVDASRIAGSGGGHCDLDCRSVPISISDITPEGCLVEGLEDWDEDADFLHLRIADHIEINGRMLWHKGRRASIRFFGQIHPFAIDGLSKAA